MATCEPHRSPSPAGDSDCSLPGLAQQRWITVFLATNASSRSSPAGGSGQQRRVCSGTARVAQPPESPRDMAGERHS